MIRGATTRGRRSRVTGLDRSRRLLGQAAARADGQGERANREALVRDWDERRVLRNDEEPVVANLGRAAATEGAQAAFQVERSCRRADGARLDLLISAALLHDAEGRHLGFFGQVQDLTERNRAARQLRTSEARLRSVITSAPIVLTAYDTDGICPSPRAGPSNGLASPPRSGSGVSGRRPRPRSGRPSTRSTRTWSRGWRRPHLLFNLRPPLLDSDFETVAFRVVQEALANVAKHADATTVRVVGEREGSMVVIAVADDGVGFDPEAAGERAAATGHLGLRSMAERIQTAGGRLEISFQPCQGTQVALRLPE